MTLSWRQERADYQVDGQDFLFETKVAALWWRMGRGKTAVAASVAAQLMDLGRARRAWRSGRPWRSGQGRPGGIAKGDSWGGLRVVWLWASRGWYHK